MKSSPLTQIKLFSTKGLVPALLATVILSIGSSVLAGKGNQSNPRIFPPRSHPYGKSYGEWAASFWQWSLALPLEGHPFLDSPNDPYFDFSAGQSGKVWFWSSPDGPLTRIVTMPEDKAIFLTIRDVETSTLEVSTFFGATEEDQRAKT